MSSLAKAVPGVTNAFVIQFLVMCIYAMLGVEFFRVYGSGGEFLNEQGDAVALTTSRGQEWGWEYFGNFPKSLFTMFQVLTGESWSEAICRPLAHGIDSLQSTAFALFFVSFAVVNGIVLINVVVAVLLEKMVDDEPVMDHDSHDVVDDVLHELQERDINALADGVAALKGDMTLIQEHIRHVFAMLQMRRPGAPPLFPPSTGWWDALGPGPGVKPPEMFVDSSEVCGDEVVELPTGSCGNSAPYDLPGAVGAEGDTDGRQPSHQLPGAVRSQEEIQRSIS